MSFSVENYDENKFGGLSAFLDPGQHTVRLLDLVLEEAPYKTKEGGPVNFLRLTVEGEKQESDFKGWLIDTENPDLGAYEGQIGTLNHGPFGFSQYKEFSWEEQVFNWVCDFANHVGKLEQIRKIKEEDIYSFIQKVKLVLCDPSVWFLLTIAGQEYTNKKGFSTYRLFIPKDHTKKYRRAFASLELSSELLEKKFLFYDAKVHLVPERNKETTAPTVNEFSGAGEAPTEDFETAMATVEVANALPETFDF